MRSEGVSVPDQDELLRLEYEYASRLLGSLTEIRFKLLALVPTLAGAVVALVSGGRSGVELLAIGGLGLAATSGVLAYELRNGELRRQAADRVNVLETKLFPGGPLVGAAGRTPRLYGVVPASHRLGVGLVYGAAPAAGSTSSSGALSEPQAWEAARGRWGSRSA